MKDRILETLLKIAYRMESDGPDMPTDIILTVGGILISGTVISQKQYLQLLGGGVILEIIEAAKSRGELSETDEFPDDESNDFIHLANAKFFVSGQSSLFNNGALWRGRIDAIDGFTAARPKIDKPNA